MKALLLDLMDTVMPDPFFTELPKLVGPMQDFYQIKSEDAFLKFELGHYNEELYLKNFFKSDIDKSQIEHSAHDIRDVILRTPEIFSHVADFLAAAHEHIDIYIASNYGEWIHHHLDNLQIENYLAGVFASYQMGVRKPDTLFFDKILAQLDLGPDQVVFIDDQKKNLDSATAYGIRSFAADSDWHEVLLAELA